MHFSPQKRSRLSAWLGVLVLFAVVVSLLASVVPPPERAYARDVTEGFKPELKSALQAGDRASDKKVGCSIWTDGFACAIYWVVDAITDLVVDIFLTLASVIFDSAVQLALIPLRDVTFVKIGFGITLGVTNMFFVLILLWIAIATIFDFEPYTARTLLPRLIITALLINFSLAIGTAVISLSNGIGKIFYMRIATEQPKNVAGADQIWLPGAPIASKVMLLSKIAVVNDSRPKKPITIGQAASQVGNDCLSLSNLIPVYGQITCAWSIVDASWRWTFNRPPQDEKLLATAFKAVLFKMMLTPVLIFVMLAGVWFLFVRQISLAFLLILGPPAFLLGILPATRGMWTTWWQKLFRWSFFLPAYMFFIFLSLETGAQFTNAFIVNSSGADDKLGAMMQYFMIIGLLIGSLIAANQMGIFGAQVVMKWGKQLGLGAAKITGKVAGRAALSRAAGGFTVPRFIPGIGGRQVGGAQQMMSSAGPLASALRSIPGMTRLAQQATTMQRGVIEQRKKDLGKYNPDELKHLVGMRGTTANTRAAALQTLQEKNDLRNNDVAGFNGERIRATIGQMNAIGMDTRRIQRQRPDAALRRPGELQPYATRRVASDATPQDIENMEESVAENRDAVLGLVDHAGREHVQKLANRNDQLTDAFIRELHGLDASGQRDAAAIAAKLREVSLITGRPRNEGLARFVESAPGRALLGLRGGPQQKPPQDQTQPQPQPPPPPPPQVTIAPEEGYNRRSRSRLNPTTGEMEEEEEET